LSAISDPVVPRLPLSHPAWCSRNDCRTYLTYRDLDGPSYVFHTAAFSGPGQCTAALSQREVLDATGTMELDEPYLTVTRNSVEELHLPARQARMACEELPAEAGAVVLLALSALDQGG
jgi:hypothetical protein